MTSFRITLVLFLTFIFILAILAFLQYYWLDRKDVVLGIPATGELYFLHNETRVQTNVTDMVDLCAIGNDLLIIGADGTLYDVHSVPRYKVPIPLQWCAVRSYDNTLYVGSDYGTYKFPGPFRQKWRKEPGARFVDWHTDEFVKMNVPFRYLPENDRTIVYLDLNGFLVRRVLGERRYISHRWVGKDCQAITFL
jgi:hypothetical protein